MCKRETDPVRLGLQAVYVNRTQCKKSPTKWNLPHPCTFSYSLKDLQGIAGFSDVVAGDVSFPPAREKGLVTR